MSTHSSLDPECFQKLLADAFVVQESGIESRSLSAVVELQGRVATGELDVDRAMHMVADRARNVADATGIAIALLKGEQLVYRAGSGSSAACVGRHVTAILSVSKNTQSRDEILRVENAQADGRIEAAICRQFGARSLSSAFRRLRLKYSSLSMMVDAGLGQHSILAPARRADPRL